MNTIFVLACDTVDEGDLVYGYAGTLAQAVAQADRVLSVNPGFNNSGDVFICEYEMNEMPAIYCGHPAKIEPLNVFDLAGNKVR